MSAKKSLCGNKRCIDGYLYFPAFPEVDYICKACEALKKKKKKK